MALVNKMDVMNESEFPSDEFRRSVLNVIMHIMSQLSKLTDMEITHLSWWRHQMETFSALLAICAGNSPVSGEFPTQRPVTRSFDIFFDLRLNKRLSKQSWSWWFETLACPLWRQCNVKLPLWEQNLWEMTARFLVQSKTNTTFL